MSMPRADRRHSDVVKRFLRLSAPGTNSICILWLGSTNHRGYGNFRAPLIKSGVCKAHRVAYWLWRGPFDPRLEVGHLCRNRLCVNPYHLELEPKRVNVGLGNIDRQAEKDLEFDPTWLEDLFE